MAKLTLEEAMVKAIRQFKRENKNYEIRNVYAWEWSTGHTSSHALFNIEYVDEQGEYHEMQINIRN